MKLFWKIIGLFVALSIVFGLVGLGLGWFNKGVDIVSPQNVEKQHAQVIGKYNSMIAAAQNTCTIQTSGVTPGTDRSPTMIEDPTMAYQATFRNIVVEYNSSVDNLFKAGIVAPPGYPDSVDINSIDTTDWCTVDEQLLAMKS